LEFFKVVHSLLGSNADFSAEVLASGPLASGCKAIFEHLYFEMSFVDSPFY
jgi:hypothetical protein